MPCQIIRFAVIDGLYFYYDVCISSDGTDVLGMFDCVNEEATPREDVMENPVWDGKRPVHARYHAEKSNFIDIEYKSST